MKTAIKLIVLFMSLPLFAFSQFTFSGGNGDENDPYVISTLQDLKDFKLVTRSGNADINSYYSHSNYILSNDISIPNAEIEEIQAGVLYGHFNGKGHSLVFIADGSDLTGFNEDPRHLIGQLGGTVDSLVMSGEIYHSFLLVREILVGGKISNCINYSYSQLLPIYSDSIMTSFVSARFADVNRGIIENCINYADVYASSVCGGVICLWCCNGGVVRNCKNFGSIYNAVVAAGICGCLLGDAVIENCINYGNIYTRNQNEIAQIMNAHQYEDFSVGGIVAYAETSNNTIRNCQNYGTIVSEKFHTVGGIYGGNRYYPNQANVNVENCANYGHLYNGGIIGGIVGNTFGTVTVRNCYNAGDVYGYGSILSSEHASSTSEIRNCLSVYGRSQMVRATDDGDFTMASNYYDRQMVNDTIEDIAGQEEGHITSQLVGDTPELRAMLGDGWSYAEGRYPIPLGLETDSLAMLFATPIYLYAESEEEYDDVDLVQHHFTVGTENGVSWASGSRLNIVGENATILASGSENITASLAGYSFTRNLNLINPVNIEEQDFEDVKIFPNPATDILNITSSETISEIEIVNVMGQVVKHIEVNTDNAVCDVDDLKSGVYVVRIRHFDTSTNSVHRKLSVRKFVKE